MIRHALISECGCYRYLLQRKWGDGHSIVWIMLNPSLADAEKDDPTIKKILAYSQRWGYASLSVVNLFGLVSPYPADLITHVDPIGPENMRYLHQEARSAEVVIAAWGSTRIAQGAASTVKQMLSRKAVLCLGRNKDGSPKHPLYLSNALLPQPYW